MLSNVSDTSRTLASPRTQSKSRSKRSAASSTSSASSAAAAASSPSTPIPPTVAPQHQLWTSLKLDPLLISHATGLHRVLHDVRHLKEQFHLFASHVLNMTRTGASLTAHLQRLYKPDTCPASVRMCADAHDLMSTASVDWFSSRLKNEILNLFADWIEDAESVLTQLGLVQKTRHELDGLQEEVEKLFTKKIESPVWDAHSESSLQRRLENSKEKLAAACMLYDGQRRGVEKSMTFLLEQRAQLFHTVTSCFMEYEFRFFRDFAAHAASFVQAYPYSPRPPQLDFADDPFGVMNSNASDDHSASALLLTLPYFQWSDPLRGADDSTEGPSVRAIRRSIAAQKARRNSQSKSNSHTTEVKAHENNTAESAATATASTPVLPSPPTVSVASPPVAAAPLDPRSPQGAWESSADSWRSQHAASVKTLLESLSPRSLDEATKLALQSAEDLSAQIRAASTSPVAHTVQAKEEEKDQHEQRVIKEFTDLKVHSPRALEEEDRKQSARGLKTKSPRRARKGRTSRAHSDVSSDDEASPIHEAVSVRPPAVSTNPFVASEDDENDTGTDADVFVSPQPLQTEDLAMEAASLPPAPMSPPGTVTPAPSDAAMMREVESQAAAAAVLNLPAKLLPLRPRVPLHPAIWESVSLPRVKGSVWGRILCENVEFVDDTDEMREKYALPASAVDVFEAAFRTDTGFDTFKEHAAREHQRSEQQAQVQSRQHAQAVQQQQQLMSASARTPSPSDGVSTAPRRATSTSADRFAHMKTIDGRLFPTPPPASLAISTPTCFPAAPFAHFSAKQWYVAYQLLTRVLHPLTAEQIVTALYQLDDKLLTPDRISALARIMPNADQSRAILSADRPVPLTPIEHLYTLLAMHTAPSLSQRLSAMQFQVEFGPLCSHLESTLSCIEQCVAEIKRSQNLRIVLAVLLHLGNFLNASHRVPPSYGFGLDFLARVRQIRMTNSNSTLLDFCVYLLSTNFPSISFAAFAPSAFPSMEKAIKTDEWLLATEMRHLGEEYKKIKNMNDEDVYEKQNRSVTSPSSGSLSPDEVSSPRVSQLPFHLSAFPPRVPRFLSYVQSRTTVLRHRYAKVKHDIADVCKYLCVPPKEIVDLCADAVPPVAANADTRVDLGFDSLPPLGEVAVTTAATLASSSAAGIDVTPNTHTRYDWQAALRTLHTFIAEFSVAHSDYLVSHRVSQGRTQMQGE